MAIRNNTKVRMTHAHERLNYICVKDKIAFTSKKLHLLVSIWAYSFGSVTMRNVRLIGTFLSLFLEFDLAFVRDQKRFLQSFCIYWDFKMSSASVWIYVT